MSFSVLLGLVLSLGPSAIEHAAGRSGGPSAAECQQQIAKLEQEVAEATKNQQAAASSDTHAQQQLSTAQAQLDR